MSQISIHRFMPTNPLVSAARKLTKALDPLTFSDPITHVYNPLVYAKKSHEKYLNQFGAPGKKVILLGMNPGPFGMAQTGVPFGEIDAVRDWIGIDEPVDKPENEHPKRPIEGFACTRSEVSGRRLWGLFAERFDSADAFFADHFIANYCPLVFMTETGRNFTPDKLPAAEKAPVDAACDTHLNAIVKALKPEWLIGVGAYAEGCAQRIAEGFPDLKTGRILHPSPASPAANRDWAGTATCQLEELGVW